MMRRMVVEIVVVRAPPSPSLAIVSLSLGAEKKLFPLRRARLFYGTGVHGTVLADDHKTVLLSILATTATGVLLFLVTIVVSGGVSMDMFVKWVLPVFISALSLGVFWFVLFARSKGKIPWLD